MERTERTVLAPLADWLDAAEVSEWLGISEPQLRALLRRGEFPAPAPMGPSGKRGKRLWHWLDVIAWAHLRSRGWPPQPEASPGDGS